MLRGEQLLSIYQHGIFKIKSVNGKLTWVKKNDGLQSTDIRCIAVNVDNLDIPVTVADIYTHAY
jgi:Leu/Phe-tRNA-protein transferase